MKLTTSAAFLALAAGANAQFSIAGLSGGCTSTFAGFVFGDLSSCLQITSLLPVLNSDGNSSAIDPLNGYLTSLCASSTPICSNETLTGAATNIKSGRGTELQDRTSIPNILLTVLENYTPIRQAACSKNSTNGEFCVSDALTTIQNSTGTSISFSSITSLLGGDSSTEETLVQAFGTGELCTGCVAGIYNAAVQVNSTVSNSSIGKVVTAQCGADFAKSAVSASAPASSAAAATGTGAATAGAGSGAISSGAGWFVGAGTLAAVVLGAIVAL